MCGIAGIIYFNKSKKVRSEELQLMSNIIKHRGPDDEGYFISKDKNVGLVSRRLAIIDLSKKGHMPMTYLNRFTITFNGEIYNFQEERQKLEREGYKFKSNSDTEVILILYSKYGTKCLSHLRGMFAFAIYDSINHTIFAARDRIGKKPFKYILDNDRFIFSSELKAILNLSGITREIDELAIQKYLIYGYVPAPLTGFKNIKKLSPGSYIFINLKSRSVLTKRYWIPKFKYKLNLSEKEWSRKILETLEESTKLRMISDVPIGSFLSGGVDSSAVTALMAMNSNKPINTFSILFQNKKYSEKKYADLIVKRYKTNHHELMAQPTSIEILPKIAKSYEEPFADNSAIVSFMISRMAKKYVTVTLNGDGGDEIFAGYPNRYLRLKRDVNYYPFVKVAKKILRKQDIPIYGSFSKYSRIFDSNDFRLEKEVYKNFNGRDLKDAGLKFDQLYFLPDQLLAKIDIATMHYSLEARSPLLDQKMIELAGKIPFNLKIKNGETKYIFKKALEQIVPKENLYRPKVGFTVPLEDWFKKDLDKFCKNILDNKKAFYKNFVNKSDNLTNQQKWTLMMLELWFTQYF